MPTIALFLHYPQGLLKTRMSKANRKRKALVVITWQNPNSNQLLVLLLRRPESEGGYWQPVTGGVERDESFAEGALREAIEETGLDFIEETPISLGLEVTFSGRWGEATEQCFTLSTAGDSPPKPTLDPKEHCEYQWVEPVVAHSMVAYAHPKDAIFRATFRASPIHVSAEGILSQDGEEITHERTKALLYRSIERNEDRFPHLATEYVVHVEGAALPVEVEDTPLHIRSVDPDNGTVTLLYGETLPLEPVTVSLAGENCLYCKLKGMRAKFLRSAYYKMAEHISEQTSDASSMREYSLHWLGRDYQIAVTK